MINETESKPKPDRRAIFSVDEWLSLELNDKEQGAVLGTPENPIVRPLTKNLIQAPEKSFKTTFLLRLAMGLATGQTVYPGLPVPQPRKVFYAHGELSKPEIRDRTKAAVAGLNGPFGNVWEGRILDAHLITPEGQKELRTVVEEFRPDDLILDAWQSFIAGYDENSYQAMSSATRFCDDLIADYGVTLWIPIHLGKDHRRGARGHSSIAGWRDTLFQLHKDENIVTVTVEPRWAAPPEPFSLRFSKGTMIPTGKSAFAGQTAEIRALVEAAGGEILWEDLVDQMGKSPDAVRKAVKRAIDVGAVKRNGSFVVLPASNSERIM